MEKQQFISENGGARNEKQEMRRKIGKARKEK